MSNLIFVRHSVPKILQGSQASDFTGLHPCKFLKALGMLAFAVITIPELTLIQLINKVKIEN